MPAPASTFGRVCRTAQRVRFRGEIENRPRGGRPTWSTPNGLPLLHAWTWKPTGLRRRYPRQPIEARVGFRRFQRYHRETHGRNPPRWHCSVSQEPELGSQPLPRTTPVPSTALHIDPELNCDYILPSVSRRTDHTTLIFDLHFLWTVFSTLN